MNATMSKNGRMPRPSLATQIDRLDGILDGLAEALNESVADAVKDAVGLAVREAVQSTLKEVLGNPELLRAALAQHSPPPPPPPSRPARKTLRERLAEVRAWVLGQAGEKASQVSKNLASGWTWFLMKFQHAYAKVKGCLQTLIQRSLNVGTSIGPAIRQVWRFRRPCVLALSVGLLSGLGAYLAGPVFAGVACGLGSTVLTLAGMVLVPLWRLLRSSTENA
jgi:hypothetical protein